MKKKPDLPLFKHDIYYLSSRCTFIYPPLKILNKAFGNKLQIGPVGIFRKVKFQKVNLFLGFKVFC